MASLAILLIDDHAMFRSGMVMLLRAHMVDIRVFEAASLDEALHGSHPAPAVVLLDIELPGLSGLECIAVLQQRWPQAVIIMLSADTSPATQQRAIERGAAAFVSKADTPSTMVAVIRQALHHTPGPLPAECVCSDACCHPSLTPRQSEVLDLLCQGLSNKAIGRRLGISENTVRTHVQALLALLQVSGRSQAVYAARRMGLVG